MFATVDRLAVHEVASILRRGRAGSMLRSLHVPDLALRGESALGAGLEGRQVPGTPALARASSGGDAAAGKSHLGADLGVRRPGGAGIQRHHQFCRRALAGSPAHVADRGGTGPRAGARALARRRARRARAPDVLLSRAGRAESGAAVVDAARTLVGPALLSRGLSRRRQPHPRLIRDQRGHGGAGSQAGGGRFRAGRSAPRGTLLSGGRPLRAR